MQGLKTPLNNLPPAWLLLNAAALASTLAHTLIDQHIGLFGETSSFMSPLQAGNILMQILLLSVWIISLALAFSGRKEYLSIALTMAAGWALVGNGAAAVIAAPPPSAAFPYQDFAHFGSLIFGGMATFITWREIRVNGERVQRLAVLSALALIFLASGISGILALSNL
jgi:hypothetical protein